MCLYRIFSVGNICCLHFWFLTCSLDILNRKIYALLCFYCFHVRRSSKQTNTDFWILWYYPWRCSFLGNENINEVIPIQATVMPFLKSQIPLISLWMKALIIKKLLNYWILNSFLTFSFITNKTPHEMLCAAWYYLYNFKNVKNTRGGVLLLIML